MTQPMEKRFTFGNLLNTVTTVSSCGLLLVYVTSAFNDIDAKTVMNSDANTRLEDSFRSFASRVDVRLTEAQTSITSLQVANARTEAQYDALLRSMDEMKGSLREISTILRNGSGPK